MRVVHTVTRNGKKFKFSTNESDVRIMRMYKTHTTRDIDELDLFFDYRIEANIDKTNDVFAEFCQWADSVGDWWATIGNVYWFMSADDALKFRLRWGGNVIKL